MRRSEVEFLLQQALHAAECQAMVAPGASAGAACGVRHSMATSLLQQALHVLGMYGRDQK